jgi:hypothetical protein
MKAKLDDEFEYIGNVLSKIMKFKEVMWGTLKYEHSWFKSLCKRD